MTAADNVCEIAAAETHDLRRRILREGAADANVEWHGDDESTTAHLGVSVDGRIVAISTWLITPDPSAPNLRSVQLRGMATDPTMTGRGLGRSLLDAGMQQAGRDGYERVWANARVTALGFYEGAGWTISGPVFETASTGLPHRQVHADLV
jgi:GNAT superfamily N-acetyltransferase